LRVCAAIFSFSTHGLSGVQSPPFLFPSFPEQKNLKGQRKWSDTTMDI